MARHRRPVNVRDDGLTAVLGPLVTVGGVERAVLLDVDSGMVLDAWACGEASPPGSAAPGPESATGPGHGPAPVASSAQSDETVPGGATFHGLGSEPGRGGASVTGSGHGFGAERGRDGAPGVGLVHGFGAEPGRGGASDAGSGHGFGSETDIGGAPGTGPAWADDTVPGGDPAFGAGADRRLGGEPGRGGVLGFGSARSDETVPGSRAWPGFGSLWRSLLGPAPAAAPAVDSTETRGGGDVEAFGARHADLVRALLALPGSPPAELSLVVDDRHHLLRCVADPAGGRLALAVVVAGSPWVVRRVRRHLRQLPDAGLTTGPWLLSWAVGPPPTPWPPAEHPPREGPPPDARAAVAVDGRHPPTAAEWPPHDGWSGGAVGDRQQAPADSHSIPDGVQPPPPGEPGPDGSDDPAADPRRGPAPPSALPPARSTGGR